MKMIFVDVSKCTGCRSCEINCAVAHSKSKTLFGALSEEPKSGRRLYVEAARDSKIPVLCRHCDEAPCINSCVSGCLYKDADSLVRRHKERCIGCWSCIMACPFGVISQDKARHIAVKCDRCHKLDTPACVSGCPTRALFMMEADDFAHEKRLKIAVSETTPV